MNCKTIGGMLSPESFIQNIDWKLLSGQKTQLLELIGAPAPKLPMEAVEALDGIVHLIDGIQDLAVQSRLATEAEVFAADPP